MKINSKNFRTIWPHPNAKCAEIIDQTLLPHRFEVKRIDSLKTMVVAIKTMQVRGAPLIGAAAAYGIALATLEDAGDENLAKAAADLLASRPTAVNLRWALERILAHLQPLAASARATAAWAEAAAICDEDVVMNKAIGQHGLKLIQSLVAKKNQAAIKAARRMQDETDGTQQRDSTQLYGEAASTAQQSHASSQTLNILTHCNAGWLATVDWGTALAPVYAAHDVGLPVHVWVDETRPRNQGASLTAWELGQHGVPHTVVTDNAGGHLMQHGKVDLVMMGADRVTSTGDVCNKIGSYLKALAALDNEVPFYVAVPSPTIDWTITDGLREIPIEERSADEMAFFTGRLPDGNLATVNILPTGSAAANPAFDVTPARLVTGIITERGVCTPGQLGALFPEKTGGKT